MANKNKPAISLGSLTAVRDLQPSMVINVKSELDIHTGKPKYVKITVTQLEKEKKKVPELYLDLSGCGNSTALNLHVGLRGNPFNQISFDAQSGERLPPMITTDDYSREVLKALTKRLGLNHLEIMVELRRDQDFRVFKPCPSSNPFPTPPSSKFPTFLKHLQIELPGISPSNLPLWKYVLEQQTHLRTLICNFGVILWTFYALTITQNSQTLEKVILRRIRTFDPNNPLRCNSFDWSIFQNCDKLRFIKITCARDDVNRLYALANPEQPYGCPDRPDDKFTHYNFTSLNLTSLEEIHLARVNIDIKNLQWLKTNSTKLTVFCVECPDKEFYDADKEDTQIKQGPGPEDERRNHYITFDNFHFLEVVDNPEETRDVALCCSVVCVVSLLTIALIMGILFIYNQNKYDTHHITTHLNH